MNKEKKNNDPKNKVAQKQAVVIKEKTQLDANVAIASYRGYRVVSSQSVQYYAKTNTRTTKRFITN